MDVLHTKIKSKADRLRHTTLAANTTDHRQTDKLCGHVLLKTCSVMRVSTDRQMDGRMDAIK